MSLLTPIHTHQFFKNKELNHFYIAIAIITFGEAIISIFVPIYFFKLNYSIQKIIFFYFLVSLGFVAFSYIGAKIVSRVGVKHSILISTPFLIIYYIGLKFIEQYPFLFFILPFLLSFRMILYNYGYHLNFLTHSEKENRGKEISFVTALTMMMYVLAPLIGGFIAYYSFSTLYLVGAAILIIGTFPLFFTKDSHEKLKFNTKTLFKKIFLKKDRGILISHSGYAIESIINKTIWPIFLIIFLTTTQKIGIIVAITTFFSLITLYVIGGITDRFNKVKIIKFATLFYSLSWVGRIFADSSLKILLIDSYKNITQTIIYTPWLAQSYDLSLLRDHFRFIVDREIIFNLTRIIILPILILIFFINWHPLTITLIIAAVSSIGYGFINKK